MNSNWDDAAEKQALGAEPRGSGRLIGLFVLLGVILLGVWVLKSRTPQSDPTKMPAVGKHFDQLSFEPLTDDAEPITIDSLAGEVVLVNYWGPWCGPCRSEFPELMELRKDLKPKQDFRFVSVSCSGDGNDTNLVAQTNTYLKQQGFELPIHRDPRHATGQALLNLNNDQGFVFPTTVLLDKQGVIRALWLGYQPGIAKDMRERIDALLK